MADRAPDDGNGGGGGEPPSLDYRVGRLEEDMREVRTKITHMDSTLTEIRVALSDIAANLRNCITRQDLDAVKAEMAEQRTEFAVQNAEMREGLRAEMATMHDGLRAEMATTRDGLRAEMATVRDGLRTELTTVRDGLRTEMTAVREGLIAEMATMREDIAFLRGRSENLPTTWQMIVTMITTWAGGAALVFAVLKVFQ